jgi:hypothetical protein
MFKSRNENGHRRSSWGLAIGVFIMCEFLNAAALGAEPVAMVMGISGAAEPILRDGEPLDEGKRVSLGPDARLTFIIFGKCGLFTATGGTITFLRGGAEPDGGNLAQGIGPCNRVHDLRKGEELVVGGGMTLRHGNLQLRVSARPKFLLGGPGAARVVGAQLVPLGTERRPPIAMALADGRIGLEGSTLLRINQRYALKLEVLSGKQPSDLSFEVAVDVATDVIDVLIVN